MSLPKKNRVYCCVSDCRARSCDNSNLSFHNFPKITVKIPQKNYFGKLENCSLRELWIKSLNIRRKNIDSLRVCSNHFNPDDFFSKCNNRRILKKTAIPVLNSYKETANVKKKRTDRLKSRNVQKELINYLIQNDDILSQNKEQVSKDVIIKDEQDKCNKTEDIVEETNKEEQDNSNEMIVECSTSIKSQEVQKQKELNSNGLVKLDLPPVVKSMSTIGVQTNATTFFDTITTNSELMTLTGIPDFETLNLLINVALLTKPSLAIVRTYSVKVKILVTMMKLKHDISYTLLSLILKCSVRNCSKIVNDMLDVLETGLKDTITWPSKEKILSNIPICFDYFKNVRVFVDCTEIAVQKPKNSCCQALSYSQCKDKEIVKIMTGVSPAGTIIFVSKVYGGKVSDSFIFKHSGIMSLLEEKDVVMTDKGFLINEFCKQNNVTLIRPLLKDKARFNKEEALFNSLLASAHVHVKKCNQRIKEFKVLRDKMPAVLFSKSQQILTIVCALINLSAPVLENNKFLS